MSSPAPVPAYNKSATAFKARKRTVAAFTLGFKGQEARQQDAAGRPAGGGALVDYTRFHSLRASTREPQVFQKGAQMGSVIHFPSTILSFPPLPNTTTHTTARVGSCLAQTRHGTSMPT